MGRPRKDKEHKLSRVVVFRLTEAEFRKLESFSVVSGRPIGTMVRTKLFTGSYPRPVMPQVNHLLYAELNRIGNNINQLARRANAGFLPKGHTEILLEILNRLSLQQKTIINLLLNDRR
jgi:hypothetical protein